MLAVVFDTARLPVAGAVEVGGYLFGQRGDVHEADAIVEGGDIVGGGAQANRRSSGLGFLASSRGQQPPSLVLDEGDVLQHVFLEFGRVVLEIDGDEGAVVEGV